MSRKGLSAAEKQMRTDKIIVAALNLFEKYGYEETRIDEIVRAADVSPRTFFRYFKTKADLVLTGRAGDEHTLAELVLARPAEETTFEAIIQITSEILREATSSSDTISLRQFRVATATPSLRPLCREQFAGGRMALISAFARRSGAKETDLIPKVLGSACAEAIWNAAEQWLEEGGEPENLQPILIVALNALKTELV